MELMAGAGAGTGESMIPRCPSSGSSSYVKREPEAPAAHDGITMLGMSVRGSGGLVGGNGSGGTTILGKEEAASLRLMETLGLGHGEGRLAGGSHSARVNLGSRQQKRAADVRKGGGGADRVKVFGRISADQAGDADSGVERVEDWALWEGKARGASNQKGSHGPHHQPVCIIEMGDGEGSAGRGVKI